MYEGKNPTAIQSQEWLVESLLSLMAEKPFSKISVMDICRKADLSRQTFYNFFADKEEILHYYLHEKYLEAFIRYYDKEEVTISDVAAAFLNVFIENEKIFTYILDNDLSIFMALEIAGFVETFADYFIKDDKKDDLLKYREAILTGAMGNVLLRWLKQEKRASKEELAQLFSELFKGGIFNMTAQRGRAESMEKPVA